MPQPSTSTKITRRQALIGLGGAGAAGVLAACGGADRAGSPSVSPRRPADAAGNIVFWSWSPHAQDLVDLFEKAHPKVKVTLVNNGGGPAQYQKLQTVFAAGSGAPDVAMVEYAAMPQYVLAEYLAPLDDLGAASVKNDFVDSVMTQCTINGKVYGMPLDAAPMGLAYRQDILEKHDIDVPTTWDEFRQAARDLRAADDGVHLANSMIDDTDIFSAIWQAGGTPFKIDGTTLIIDFQQEQTRKTVQMWVDLVKDDLVSTIPAFTPDWNQAWAKSRLAAWPMAAWGPLVLEPIAKATSGKWRVAPLPHWGTPASAEWGGSAYCVTDQSANKEAAALFAIWVNHDPAAAALQYELNRAFPVLKSMATNSEVVSAPAPFFGDQRTTEVFSQALPTISRNWQWDPFNTYTSRVVTERLQSAEHGDISVDEALSRVQEELTAYARKQGFTVG